MNPLQRFWSSTKHYWWIFPLCAAIGLLLSVAVTLSEHANYTATAQVLITAGDGGSLVSGNSQNTTVNIADATLLAQSDSVFRIAANGLSISPQSLTDIVAVGSKVNTDALEFTAKDPSSQNVIRYANAVATAFTQYYTHIFSLPTSSVPAAQLVAPAQVSKKSTVPLDRNLGAGVFAGLIVALFVVGILESTDKTIRAPGDLDASLRIRSVFIPRNQGPLRTESVRHLDRQIRLGRSTTEAMRVGLVAVNPIEEGTALVASLVRRSLEESGLKTTIGDAESVETVRGETGAVDLITVSRADFPLVLDRSGDAISLWFVVAVLGHSTEADLDEIKLALTSAGVSRTRVTGVALQEATKSRNR